VTVTPFGRASPLDIHTRSVGEGEATIVANNDDLNYKDLVSQFIVKRRSHLALCSNLKRLNKPIKCEDTF